VLGFLSLGLLSRSSIFVPELVKVSLISVVWFACLSLVLRACAFAPTYLFFRHGRGEAFFDSRESRD
jgi:hypothetical protein